MLSSKHSVTAITAALVFTFSLFAQRVIIDKDNGFPAVSILNPSGRQVNIRPVSSLKGSIGFEKDGAVFWIKGKPEIMAGEAGATACLWKIDSLTRVELQVDTRDNEIEWAFTLKTGDHAEATQWFINIAADEDEYFTGIFERVVDGPQTNSWAEGIETAMNLRGEHVEMKLKPTVSAYAPFYISSANYGIFVRGTWPGNFDFCREYQNTVQIAFEGPAFAFKIYLGNPLQIVQNHALETGPSVVPPEWALGPWRWRDNHVHRKEYYDGTEVHAPFNSEVVEDVLMMQAYGIPCTAYWLDRPWGPGPRGFDDYEFDPERFPNPEQMIRWLNSRQIEMMIWIAPFVMGDMADVAEEKGYSLKSNIWKQARQVLMDFTNEEACQWWGENGPGKLARMGIKGFKMDRADGEKLLDSLHLVTSAGTTYRENYNDYPVQYVRAAYHAVNPVLNEDFILFPRAQYTGSARYGAMWSGDPRGTPEGLRSVIIAVQRCAVMGYPVWGSDIGGYGRMFNRETCMRWLGFGCFCPIMENGPNVDRGFWNSPDTPAYDTELIATWRLYAVTRMKLVPYLHDLAKEASQTGMPIVRPLFLLYPDQPEAWEDWQTYQFGPDILVSAVWEKGKTRHSLYLPAGENWIDAWDGKKVHKGGKMIETEVPPYKIPIFIRKGSKIDLGNLNGLYQESLRIAAEKPDLTELEKAEGWHQDH
ncbi:alpha-glucosidase [bacterium]|nr:alpha-glucosidase [bacterium]